MSKQRFQFIDFTRGVVMAIMAWDHVSGFWNRFHGGGEGVLGAKPAFLNLKWFLARYVSHYCAPTFVFLAGTVLAISTLRRLERGDSQFTISKRMATRGLILLALMYLSVSPAFGASEFYFGVIACIGTCFIIFSVARLLPRNVILILSIAIVLLQQYIDLSFIPTQPDWGWYLRVILHEPNHLRPPYTGLYPIFPWIGVMGLGWVYGTFLNGLEPGQVPELKRTFLYTGLASVVAFFLVRWNNGYGNLLLREGTTIIDPHGRVWDIPKTQAELVIDWLYVSKYPPSLAFLLWTLGGMCLMMYIGLRLKESPGFNSGISGVLLTFGRSPLFFYLAHLWLYKLKLPGQRRTPVLPMFPTLILWVVGLTALWWMCDRYERVKRDNPRTILQYI